MTGQDLTNAIQQLKLDLNSSVEHLQQNGIKLAKAERDYRVAKAQKLLALKAQGIPATIMADIVKGDDDVSTLCLLRDIAQVKYDTTKESINKIKLEMRVVAEEINREWAVAKYEQ